METTRGTASTTLKLPRHVDALWSEVSRQMGMNKTAVFTLAIRELAKKEGIPMQEAQEGAGNEQG